MRENIKKRMIFILSSKTKQVTAISTYYGKYSNWFSWKYVDMVRICGILSI